MVIGPFLLYAIVKTFFFTPYVVEGQSMMPTLQNGELFLVDKMSYLEGTPRRDDIIVFYLDNDPSYFYIKRVIGLPGDHIHLAKDGVYLADPGSGALQKLYEPFIMPDPHPTDQFLSMNNELGQDFVVPPGGYFVLGDNRENSKDSRFFKNPFIPTSNIVGKFGIEIGVF